MGVIWLLIRFVFLLFHQPWPLRSSFGWRIHPITRRRAHHGGNDWDAPHGTLLGAPVKGTAYARLDQNHPQGKVGFGAYIKLVADNGRDVYYLAHLSQWVRVDGKPVKAGDSWRVEAGDPIARSGGIPGSWGAGYSTGDHLHFELRRDGTPIDSRGHEGMLWHPEESSEQEDDVRLVFKVKGEPGVWISDNGAFRIAVASGEILKDLGYKESEVVWVPPTHPWARLPKLVRVVSLDVTAVSEHVGDKTIHVE